MVRVRKSFIDRSIWTVKELRVQKLSDDYEVPIIVDQADMIRKSREHFAKAELDKTLNAVTKILEKFNISSKKIEKYVKARIYGD